VGISKCISDYAIWIKSLLLAILGLAFPLCEVPFTGVMFYVVGVLTLPPILTLELKIFFADFSTWHGIQEIGLLNFVLLYLFLAISIDEIMKIKTGFVLHFMM